MIRRFRFKGDRAGQRSVRILDRRRVCFALIGAGPGDVVSVNALAMALGVPATCIHEIVNARRGITADTAERLASCFGGDAASWLALQADQRP
jgi:hypothetical protein